MVALRARIDNIDTWQIDTKDPTYQNQVTKLLHLHASLEGKLKFTTLNYNIGEVEQVHFERICITGNECQCEAVVE